MRKIAHDRDHSVIEQKREAAEQAAALAAPSEQPMSDDQFDTISARAEDSRD